MIYLKGHLARPLDAVLTAPSRLAVLRQLARAKSPLSGRQLGILAGINHQGAALALNALHGAGIVRRGAAGRAAHWSLDRRRWLVEKVLLPLLEGEAEHADAIAGAIKAALKGKCAAAMLAGAASQSRLRPGMDLELIVIEGSGGRHAAGNALRALSIELEERWALKLSPRVLSARAAEREGSSDILWQLLPVEGPATLSARA